MTECPRCKSEVPDESRFCHICGQKLEKRKQEVSYADIPAGTTVVCPKCGAKNFRTDSICRKCEADLTEAKKAIAGKITKDAENGLETCMRCGRVNPSGYQFCSVCGNPLGASPWVSGSVQDEIGVFARTLFYLVSFFIPVVGLIIGAVFYARTPDPRGAYRTAGILCLVLAVANLVIGIIVVVALWAANFSLERGG